MAEAHQPMAGPGEPRPAKKLLGLALAALGVVYGDIGTSPLYAVRECFKPERAGLTPSPDHVLTVLSLVFWALTLVVVVKYLTVVLRADNHGEGGILALLALLLDQSAPAKQWAIWTVLGIFGTALLLADGMITPAISILSAVEGLEVAAPQLDSAIVPLTVVILAGLFLVQRHGTGRIARFFGPAMLVWFVTIGLLGLPWIIRHPEVLAAVDPRHGLALFLSDPGQGALLLGAIVLCVTGAEALYADLGHFGRGPIRLAWYVVAFPALLLNYFGQGALVLSRGGNIVALNEQGAPETIHLFYAMVPPDLLYPVLALATLATIIASQALISGAYSLAEQAVQLGYLPRLTIIHTSDEIIGQIYVPFINWSLMIASVLLVIGFRHSSRLADAYGIAVVGTMAITSVLLFRVMRTRWRWSLAPAALLVGLFLAVDLPLLAANLDKVATGGWVPLLVAAALFTAMMTWRRGRALLDDPGNTRSYHFPLELFVKEIEVTKPRRDEETAVFMTAVENMVPTALQQMVERTRLLPKRLVLFTVRSVPVPTVADDDAIEIRHYPQGCHAVTARHGFMEGADMGRFLAICTRKGLELDPSKVFFYLSRMTLITTGPSGLAGWRKALFAFLYHNARPATSYYHLPADRVVELGRVVEL